MFKTYSMHNINLVKHYLSTPLSQIIVKAMMIDDVAGASSEIIKLSGDIKNLVDEIYRRIDSIEKGTLPEA